MTITVAHDYCTQKGGAERVALTLLQAFPDSELVTSVYDREHTFREFGDHRIRTSHLQRVGDFRHDPRHAFPFLASVWNHLTAEGASAVVCSSSGWSHAVRVEPGVPKVVYCHNPARWLYQPEDYLADRSRAVAAVLRGMAPSLRQWDRRAAQTATLYVANSSVVAQRIKATYGIDAIVVNPPSALDPSGPQEPVPGVEPGYLLSVGRGRGYKNTDVVARAVARYGKAHLVVVGGYDGVEAHQRVTRLENVSDAELRWLYANAQAVVSLSREDFGLTPVEGFGFGTPAVLVRGGGFLDSMVEGTTGTFAEEATETAFIEALERLPGSYQVDGILRHARNYSVEAFQRKIHGLVAALTTAQPLDDIRVPQQRTPGLAS